jgi:TrmH family RNA methyltransferase
LALPDNKNIADMLSKNEVKYIQSLCHKKSRDEEGLFIAEGPKMMNELRQSNYEIIKAYALKEWLYRNTENKEQVIEVSPSELERISALKTPNEVLVIAKQKVVNTEPILKGHITLVLDGIQDPGNMGTIIRIADWFGINQIVASENSVELYNPKVVQATMGSVFRIKVWYKDLTELLEEVTVPVFGALLNGKSIYEIGTVGEGILVIGNESKGISEEVLQFVSNPVTIPKFGEAESLNAAIATGIILSHFRK